MKRHNTIFALIAAFAVMLLPSAASAFAADCKQPLDQKILDQLQLGWHPDVQVQPGTSLPFSLAILSSFAPATEVPACATWKVAPEGKGANIAQDGLLTIAADTAAGSRFVVTADIENGRAQRTITVHVYTRRAQPLVGIWVQKAQYDCETGKAMPLSVPIKELEFRASGWFSVTWMPFETYRDYWGEYSSNAGSGAVSLKVTDGNFVPRDFLGDGAYKLTDDGKTLELSGLYLGKKGNDPPQETKKPGPQCRFIFTRQSQPN